MFALPLIARGTVMAMGLAFVLGCSTLGAAPPTREQQEHAIDDQANEAIRKLYADVAGSRDLAREAEGILVFPALKAGGPRVGSERGRGVLRERYRSKEYFRIEALPQGLQSPAAYKAIVFLFLTPGSLDRVRRSSAWTAGTDASVSVARMGAKASLDAPAANAEVVAFALADSGLMTVATVDGTRIARLVFTEQR